jgi:Rho-binding antiterminator
MFSFCSQDSRTPGGRQAAGSRRNDGIARLWEPQARDEMSMNNERIETSYQPISCANYDQYEIAILHGSKMHLTWQAGNIIHDQVVTPLNLRTAHGEEYLIVRLASGETAEVRLDHIRGNRIP